MEPQTTPRKAHQGAPRAQAAARGRGVPLFDTYRIRARCLPGSVCPRAENPAPKNYNCVHFFLQILFALPQVNKQRPSCSLCNIGTRVSCCYCFSFRKHTYCLLSTIPFLLKFTFFSAVKTIEEINRKGQCCYLPSFSTLIQKQPSERPTIFFRFSTY